MTDPAPGSGQPDSQQDLSEAVRQVLHTLDAHSERLTALETAATPPRSAADEQPHEPTEDPDQSAGTRRRALTAWVDWLRETYRMQRAIPPGWEQDPALTAELQALHWAYKAAYKGVSDQDGSAQPLAWHEALARAQPRLQDRVDRRAPAESDLEAWVDWLRETYQLGDTIPHDWADYPPIAAELRALHGAYRASENADDASFTRLSWLDALARVCQRLPAWQHHAERRARLAAEPARAADGRSHNSSS